MKKDEKKVLPFPEKSFFKNRKKNKKINVSFYDFFSKSNFKSIATDSAILLLTTDGILIL